MAHARLGRHPGPSNLISDFLGFGGSLGHADLFCLQTLGTALYDERDASAFIQGAIATGFDGGIVDKHILAVLALDKTKPFSGVKPLYCTCFFHSGVLFLKDFLAMNDLTPGSVRKEGNELLRGCSFELDQMDVQVPQELTKVYHSRLHRRQPKKANAASSDLD